MSNLVKDSENALNVCSLGSLFSLWHLSQSPAFYVMLKMRDFSSFNAFLAECSDISINDFIPEISFNSDVNKDNSINTENDGN